MNGDEIYDAINDLAKTSGTKAKLEKLKEYVKDEFFKDILWWTYHPFKVYGVKDIPDPAPEGSGFGEVGMKKMDYSITMVLPFWVGSGASDKKLKEIAQLLGDYTEKSAEVLRRILRKDFACGIGKSTINKACPNLIPVFPYMRCCLPKDANIDDFSWDTYCFSQEKADGMFVNLNVSAGVNCEPKVTMYGREGNVFNNEKFKDLVKEAQTRLKPTESVLGLQYHGEILVERDGKILPREISNGLINSANNGEYEFQSNERVLYKVWDRIPFEYAVAKGVYEVPYARRFTRIVSSLKDNEAKNPLIDIIPTKIVTSMGQTKAHFKEMVSQGKEGTILKDGLAIWKDGTSKQQVKFKIEFEVDLEISGFVEGQKATRIEGRTGSLTCRSADGKLVVDVAVKGEAMRDSIDRHKDEWLGKIIAVKANNIMPPTESNENYSLFLPRFVEAAYRVDKSEADTLERIQHSFDTAI